MLPIFADLEQQVTSLGLKTVLYSSIVLIVAIALATLFKHRGNHVKIPLFAVMAITLVGSTAILFGSTIYLNTKSESKGPVHWHADIEFWVCGTEVELRDPSGALTNKIGTATYHEHNDKRIHLEGVVVKKSEDAGLQKFMRVTGGYLEDNAIGIPLNDSSDQWYAEGEKTDGDKQGNTDRSYLEQFISQDENAGTVMKLRNGFGCGGSISEVQVFVYTYDKQTKTYSQRKLEKPTDYILRDESVVPPGDCVIVEYGSSKPTSDKLCRQYGVRDANRCTEFGVENFDPELCNIRESN